MKCDICGEDRQDLDSDIEMYYYSYDKLTGKIICYKCMVKAIEEVK